MLSPDSSIGRRATTLGQHTITILVDSIRICKSSHEVGGQLNLQLFLGGSKLVDFWEEQLDPIRSVVSNLLQTPTIGADLVAIHPISSSKAELCRIDADQLALAGGVVDARRPSQFKVFINLPPAACCLASLTLTPASHDDLP
ncbi:hypothetical protein PGT21_000247 [Puccinia graminis f. sp. tritici]|uniref:Uncharacterized protein n=1 Tax=Puccinia graminis f. sp. tritici TaxID=56615 RepID=A0A5B0N544_PUCGR|nr:hypothetical protein PGT21_000247 [Puccinia graminis f. sp. tritici]